MTEFRPSFDSVVGWDEDVGKSLLPSPAQRCNLADNQPRKPGVLNRLTSLELCAGGGGQALGLESAEIDHAGLVEIEANACNTLRFNRPQWKVFGPGAEGDIRHFKPSAFRGVDLVAGGPPCPPFSVAGKQLGESDDRNLFPAALRIIDEVRPKAVMIENVRGLLDAVFADYRLRIERQLQKMGYVPHWHLFNASEFGVPQLRPRVVFVAIAKKYAGEFSWPTERVEAPTVGEKLYRLIASRGWKGAKAWRERANEIAPTIVGGSLKHGGPDLGPTRAKKAWATLCVDAHGLADEPPSPEFVGMPRLTVQMIALLQGFPPEWKISGGKTAAYRQVGNAFPPPVAAAVARRIHRCLTVRQLVQVGAS